MAQARAIDRQPIQHCTTAVIATALALLVMGVSQARAQDPSGVDQYDHPYGTDYGIYNRPIDPDTRDANGNRVIVDGQIVNSSSHTSTSGVGGSSLSGEWANWSSGSSNFNVSASAIGNSLNVVTTGSNNIVIVDSTQINNGDQNAEVVLNGDIDLD